MKQEKTFEVTAPYPRVEVRLPGNGGVLKGVLTAITEKPSGATWIQVTVPTWTHWKTQIEVGQPSQEGLAPGEQAMWVPSFAVSADEDDVARLRREYRATTEAV